MAVIGPMHLYSAPWLCQLIVLPSECDDELVSSDLGPGGSPADMALTLAYSMKSLLILLAITMPAAVAQQDTSIQLTTQRPTIRARKIRSRLYAIVIITHRAEFASAGGSFGKQTPK